MAIIGSEINDVIVKFAPGVNRDIDQPMIEGLRRVMRSDIAGGHVLKEIYISSAGDQHEVPGKHVQGSSKAIEISRINGMRMLVSYSTDKSVQAIVAAIQMAFERYPLRHENLGPAFKKKRGAAFHASGHRDRIRLSVG